MSVLPAVHESVDNNAQYDDRQNNAHPAYRHFFEAEFTLRVFANLYYLWFFFFHSTPL